MGLSRVVRCITAGAVLGATSLFALAQTPRISGAIDSIRIVTLPANVSPRLRTAKDHGLAAPERQLTNMTLRFAMTDAQQAALTQLLADQQDPASPRYHQWLTPEQFAARFGLPAADVAKVSGWLTSQGFTLTETSRGGTFLRFSGTVAQAEQAFSTEIHSFAVEGQEHIANVSAPSLPAAIANVTSAISGLSDFRPTPRHQTGSASIPQTAAGPIGTAQPQYTSATTGNHYLAPGDFYTIYNESALISGGITGAGVTVAVVGQSDIDLSDIAAFRSASGLSASAPMVKLYGADPGKPNADYVEAELDVEWAGAAAPGATVLYVNSTNAIDGSLTEAIDNNLAPIIATSYGDCEPDLGAGELAYYNQLLQQASAQGITLTAPAGDAGATDCDYNVASAIHGLSVDFPASSPLVTGIGATEFNEAAGTYFSAANGANSGSALSYIPEVVWNDTGVSTRIYASGGGRSAYFSKPVWQTGTGVPADFSRDVPDVALSGSLSHDPYLICTGGSCTNGFRNSAGFVQFAGGTSVVVPAFAGLLALVEQKVGARLGNANPVLYALGNSSYAASVFHDVTVGTNASPCAAGSTDCPAGTPIGFAATTGYDLATGWGSVDAFNMVSNWSRVTPAITTTGTRPSFTNVSGSTNSVIVGATINLSAAVTSATTTTTPTPTGTIQFTVDSVAVGSAVTLSSTGTATFTLSTTSLTPGKHTVQATYGGDSTYAGSKGAFSISITAAGGADFTLTPSTATVTVVAGGVAQGVTFTVAPVNGFTGSVQLSATTSAALSAQYSFSNNPVIITSGAGSGTTTLTLLAYASRSQAVASPGSFVAASHGPMQPSNAGGRNVLWCGGLSAALAGVSLIFLPKRRRRLSALLVLTMFVALLGISGCATSNGTFGSANTPTPKGTYTVTVTATGTANSVTTSHSSTVTFVVQ